MCPWLDPEADQSEVAILVAILVAIRCIRFAYLNNAGKYVFKFNFGLDVTPSLFVPVE